MRPMFAYARSKPIDMDLRSGCLRPKDRPTQARQVAERPKVMRLPEGDFAGVPTAERIAAKGEPVAASFGQTDEQLGVGERLSVLARDDPRSRPALGYNIPFGPSSLHH
jgi:hypothetical protein